MLSPWKDPKGSLQISSYNALEMPLRSCKDPSGSFQGVISYDIIDGLWYKSFSTVQIR